MSARRLELSHMRLATLGDQRLEGLEHPFLVGPGQEQLGCLLPFFGKEERLQRVNLVIVPAAIGPGGQVDLAGADPRDQLLHEVGTGG